jgi:hypothetical protein
VGATVGADDRYQRYHDFDRRIVEPTPDKGDHLASVEEFTDAEKRLPRPQQAVGKHARSILATLRLPKTDDDHRRVLAVVTFLETRCLDPPGGRHRGW